jgi:importin-7
MICVQICDILSFFTYFSTPISPRVWAMWPVLEHVLMEWGEDFVESLILPLENFISRDTATFISSQTPDYRRSLWMMLEHCLRGNFEEMDVKWIAKLMDVVLLNCTGHVDEWVWPYLEIATERLASAKNHGCATLLMNVLPAALIYNSTLALQALETHGKTREVRGLWSQPASTFLCRVQSDAKQGFVEGVTS